MQLQDLTSAYAELEQLQTKKGIPALLAMAASGPGALRRRAVEALVALGEPALDAATKAAGDASPAQAEAGAAVLALIARGENTTKTHRTAAEKALTKALSHASSRVRRRATRAIQSEKDLVTQIDDASPTVRIAAATRLAELQSVPARLAEQITTHEARLASAVLDALLFAPPPSDSEDLQRHLTSTSRAVRRRAVAVLSLQTEPSLDCLKDPCPLVRRTASAAFKTSELADRLDQLLMTEPDAETRKAAVTSLGRMDGVVAERALARALTDGDPEVREHAQQTVQGVTSHPKETPETALLARHYIGQHKWAECVALGKDAAPALIEAATQPATTPRDVETRLGALEALSSLGIKPSADPILVGLRASDGRIRAATLRALAILQHAKTADPVRAVLADVEPGVRGAALLALSAIAGLKAESELRAGLDDPEPSVRRAAVQALGDCRAVDALGSVVRAPEDDVRALAIRLLGESQSRDAVDYVVIGLADGTRSVRETAERALRTLDWWPVGLPTGEPGGGYSRWMTRREWVEDKDPRGALDILVEGLQHPDAAFRRAALETLERERALDAIPAIGACLDDPDADVRLTAAIALAALGVAPGEGDAWAAWHAWRGAFAAAAALGAAAVAPLARLLSHRRSGQRVAAADALGATGAAEAGPAVIPALSDPEAAVRAAALRTLSRVSHTEATERVAAALDDTDARVRDAAVAALIGFGPDATHMVRDAMAQAEAPGRTAALRVFAVLKRDDLVPQFREMAASDASPTTRTAALDTLVAHLSADATPALVSTLGDRAWEVREAALSHLDQCDWDTDPVVLEASELAAQERWDSVYALGSSVVPILLGVVADSARDPLANRRRTAATTLLGRLGAKRSLTVLHRQLWDVFPDVRLATANALAALGQSASVGPLQGALEHPDVRVARAAATALADIRSAKADDALLVALTHHDAATRAAAATALGHRGSQPHALAGALADVPVVRDAAFAALATLDEQALDALAEVLRSGSTRVRRDAATLLGRLPNAADALATALLDDDAVVRTLGARGLRTHGTPPHLPSLLAVLRDPHADVRAAALAAAGHLGAAREQLLGGLADASVEVRNLTARTLVDLGSAASKDELDAAARAERGDGTLVHESSPRLVAHVLMTLRAGDDFRVGLAGALAGRDEPEVLDALADTLERGPHAGVVAAQSLSHPKAVPVWDRIERVAKAGDRACRSAALAALAAIDPARGRDALLATALDPDPVIRTTVTAGLQFVPGKAALDALLRAMDDGRPEVRSAAATALGGRGDSDAAPALVRALEDTESTVVDAAREATHRLADKATDVFSEALVDGPRATRRFLSRALAGHAAASDALLKALTDPDWVVRACAAESLGRMKGTAKTRKAFAPALSLALRDDEAGVRTAAATACGALGVDTPALVGALADGDASTRSAAVRALVEAKTVVSAKLRQAAETAALELTLGPALALGETGVPVVAHCLATWAGLVDEKENALRALGSILTPSSATALGGALSNPTRELRLAATVALTGHPYAIDVADELLTLTTERDPQIHGAALRSLARSGDLRASDRVRASLQHPEPQVRIDAAAAWATLPEAPVEPLVPNLSDNKIAVRAATATAIGTMPRGAEATDGLVECLEDDAAEVREAAILALGALAEGARDILLGALERGDVTTRRAALRVLRTDPEAVPQLITSLEDEDAAIRHGAAIALGELGATQAVDSLTPLVVDRDADVRAEAIVALGRLGGPTPPILGGLADQETRVRIAALGALRRIAPEAADAEIRDAADGLLKREIWHASRRGVSCLPLIAHALWTDTRSGLAYRRDLAKALALGDDARAILSLGAALSDRDPELRREAAIGLRQPGAARVETALRTAASDAVADVRVAALLALGTACPNTASDALMLGLEDPVPDVVRAAIEALGDAGHAGALTPLFALLAADAEPTAVAAAIALGKLGSQAVHRLIAALEDDRPRVRIAAARGLKGHEHAETALLTALEDAEPRVRAAAADALDAPESDAVEALIRVAEWDDEFDVRRACVLALSRSTDERARPEVLAALGDRHPDVQRAAVSVLDEDDPMRPIPALIDARRWDRIIARGHDAAPVLLRVLNDTRGGRDDGARRISALETLITLDHGLALAPVRSVLDDEDPAVRSAAAIGLGSLADKESVNRLAPRFADGRDTPERRAVAVALTMLGADSALIAAAGDPEADVREAAARGLPDGEVLARLLRDDDDDVRRVAATRLGTLGAADTLQDGYDTGDFATRSAVMFGIAPLQGHLPNRATELARTACLDPRPSIRRAALDAIAEARLDCLPTIIDRLERDAEDQVRLGAIRALRVVAPPGDADTLAARHARVDQSADVIREAEQALREWNVAVAPREDELVEAVSREHWGALGGFGEIVLPFAGRILGEPQTDLASVKRRVGACLALGDLASTGAQAEAVLGRLEAVVEDPAPRVRAAVARAAGRAGGERAAALLERLVADATADVRVGVCKGCESLGGDAARALLSRLVDDEVDEVRVAAAVALAGPKNAALDKLAELLLDRDPAIRIKAAGLIAEMNDPRGIQPLLDALGDANPTVRYFVRAALLDLGWTPIGFKHDADDRGYAYWTNHGEWTRRPGDTELGMLVDALTDPDPGARRTAAEGLGELGDPAAAAPLSGLLDDPDAGVRRTAARALSRLGDAPLSRSQLAVQLVETGRIAEAVNQCGLDAVAALVPLFDERGPAERAAAAWGLGLVDADLDDLEDAITALARATEDDEPDVRQAALRALARLRAESEVPALIRSLADTSADVRAAAAASLGAIGAQGHRGLVEGLSLDAPLARTAAALGLAALGTGAALGKKALANVLSSDDDDDARAAAATALCAIGDPRVAKPVATALVDDRAMVVRAACAEGMLELDWPAGRKALQHALGDDYAEVREAALRALDAQGAAPDGPALQAVLAVARQDWRTAIACGEVAIPLLARVVDDPSRDKPSVQRRAGALAALAKLGGPLAATAVVRGLDDIGGDARAEAARAAGVLVLTEAGSKLEALLDDPITPVRRNAAAALGLVGRSEAVKALRALADEDLDDGVRQAAAEALAVLGQVDVLAERLSHPSTEVRADAAKRLGELGDPAGIEPLIGALGDSVALVRSAVVDALLKLDWTPLGARHHVADAGYSRWRTHAELTRQHGDQPMIEVLRAELRDGDASARRCALEATALGRHTTLIPELIKALEDPQVDVRREAAESLVRLDAVPATGGSAASALVALGRMDDALALGDIAVPPLIRSVAEDRPSLREASAIALGSTVATADTIAALTDAAADAVARVRSEAVTALGRLSSGADVLVAALDDPSEEVAAAAAQVLASPIESWNDARTLGLTGATARGRATLAQAFGTHVDHHSDALVRMLANDSSPQVRETAATSLTGHQPTALAAALANDADSGVRTAAATALTDAANEASKDALFDALGDRSIQVRRAAIESLRASGIEPSGPRAALMFALAEERYDRLASMGDHAVAPLVRILKESGTDTDSISRRAGAIGALAAIGTAPALAAVATGLLDSAGRVRVAGARAVALHWEAARAEDRIAEALRDHLSYDGRREVQVSAAIALGRLGDEAAVPLLDTMAREGDSEPLRLTAASALGDPNLQRIEFLVDALSSPVVATRLAAVRALGESRNSAAIDPLITALGDSASSVRLAVTESLQTLGFVAVGVRHDVTDEGLSRWLTHGELRARTGKDEWADMLLSELQHPSAAARRCALEAVARASDRSFADAVNARLDDEHVIVRREAVHTLQALDTLPTGKPRVLFDVVAGDWEAVQAHGKAAVSALVRALRERDLPDRLEVVARLGSIVSKASTSALTTALRDDPADAVRAAAAAALGDHTSATVSLSAALGDPANEVRTKAAAALLKHGKTGLRVLVDHLTHAALDTRAAAVAGLVGAPQDVRETHLPDRLSDDSPLLRASAALGLSGCEGSADALVSALRADPAPGVRAAAASTLGTLAGDHSRPLLDALNDRFVEVREAALGALSDLGFEPDGDELRVSVALAREDWSALGRLGTAALPAVERVLSEVGTDLPDVSRRLGALASLSTISRHLDGVDARQAAELAARAAADVSPKVKALATRTLAHGSRDAGLAHADALVPLLKDADDRVRVGAATTLGHLGYEPAVEALVSAAHGDPSSTVRFAAAEALASPWLKQTQYLARELRAQSPSRRHQAATRLGSSDDSAAIDPLIGALGDSHALVRDAAMQSLLQLGFAPIGHRREVTDAGYARWMTRDELCDQVGVDASVSSENLYVRAIDSGDPALSRSAMEASARWVESDLAPAPPALVSALDARLDDIHPAVRAEAADTLHRLDAAPTDAERLAIFWVERRQFEDATAAGALAAAPLQRLLEDGPDDARIRSAHALASLGAAESASALTRTLHHPVADVRVAAANALCTLSVFEAGLPPALADSEFSVRHAVATALATTSDGLAALEAACSDERPEVRRAAVAGLASLESPSTRRSLVTALLRTLEDDDEGIRRDAATALGPYVGKAPARTALVEALAQDDSADVRAVVATALAQAPAAQSALVDALADGARDVRAAARDALTAQGWRPDGPRAAAIAALAVDDWKTLTTLGDTALTVLDRVLLDTSGDAKAIERRLGAVGALLGLGSVDATRRLERQLDDPNGAVRAAVVRAVGRLAHHTDPAAVPQLSRLAEHDGRPEVRRAACGALGRIGGEVGTVLMHIERSDHEPTVRFAAAEALATPGVGIIAPLVERLSEPNIEERLRTIEKLGGSGAVGAIDPLVTALGDSNAAVRTAVRDALVQLDWEPIGRRSDTLAEGYSLWLSRSQVLERTGRPEDTSQVEAILPMLDDSDPTWRQAAIDGLAARRATSYTARVSTALDDTDEGVRRSAADALRRFGTVPADGVAAALWHVATGQHAEAAALGPDAEAGLVRALRTHRDESDRARAATALGRLYGDASRHGLIQALGDSDAGVRTAAATALGARGERDGVPALGMLLTDFDSGVRSAAALALTRLGNSGRAALESSLTRPETVARRAAARALGLLGADSTPLAVTLATRLLADDDTQTRALLADALGHVTGKKGQKELETALESDAAGRVRVAAARALAYRGGKSVLAPLKSALADADAEVRAAALAGLYSLDWQPDDAMGATLVALVAGDFASAAAQGRAALPLFERIIRDRSADPERTERRARAADAVVSIPGGGADLATAALTDPARLVRGAAATALGRHDIQEAGPALLTLLDDDPADSVRIRAATALGQLAFAPAVESLESLAQHHDNVNVQLAAATALASPGLSRIDFLIRQLTSRDADVRADAATALGDARDPAAIDPLIAALGDAYAQVRQSARDALAVLGWSPVGLKADVDAGGYSRWLTRAEILTENVDESQEQLLLRTLAHPDSVRRFAAVEGLETIATTQTNPSATVGALETCLDDHDRGVRRRAAQAIAKLGGPVSDDARVHATWLAAADRAAAAVSFGPIAEPPILRLAAEGRASERVHALEALIGLSPTDRSLATLLHALDDSVADVRAAACRLAEAWTPALLAPPVSDTEVDAEPPTDSPLASEPIEEVAEDTVAAADAAPETTDSLDETELAAASTDDAGGGSLDGDQEPALMDEAEETTDD